MRWQRMCLPVVPMPASLVLRSGSALAMPQTTHVKVRPKQRPVVCSHTTWQGCDVSVSSLVKLGFADKVHLLHPYTPTR